LRITAEGEAAGTILYAGVLLNTTHYSKPNPLWLATPEQYT